MLLMSHGRLHGLLVSELRSCHCEGRNCSNLMMIHILVVVILLRNYFLVMVIIFHLKIRIQSKHTIFSDLVESHVKAFNRDVKFIIGAFLVVDIDLPLCEFSFIDIFHFLFLVVLILLILVDVILQFFLPLVGIQILGGSIKSFDLKELKEIVSYLQG